MKNKFINKYTIILLIIISFHISNNLYFLSQDNVPLASDAYNYYKGSLNYYNLLMKGKYSAIVYQFFLPHDSFVLSNSIFYLFVFFGSSQDIASFSGTIFLIILIIATYLLGKELFNRDVGLLAALLISFSPFVLAYSKVPYEDIPFAAMFTLTLYFFVKSKKFSDIKYIWFFNVFLGLTLLSKFNAFFAVFFVTVSYLFFKLIFDRRDFKNYFSSFNKKHIIHFLVSFSLSILLPIRYFISMYSIQMGNFFRYSPINNSGFSSINFVNINIILSSLSRYFDTLILNFEYLLIFLVFIFSLIAFTLFSKNKRLLILSIMVGVNIYHLFMSFLFMGKEHIPRYLIFIKPVGYLIISWFLIYPSYNVINKIFKKFKLRFSKKNYFFTLIITFLVFLMPFTLCFNYSEKIKDPLYLSNSFGKYHPLDLNFNIKKLLDEMSIDNQKNKVLLFFKNHFLIDIFASYIYHDYPNLEFMQLYIDNDRISIRDNFNMELKNYNYLIKNNTINLEKINEVDYIILLDDLKITNIEEYSVYYTRFFNYLSEKREFNLFKKISIKKINISLSIYKSIN